MPDPEQDPDHPQDLPFAGQEAPGAPRQRDVPHETVVADGNPGHPQSDYAVDDPPPGQAGGDGTSDPTAYGPGDAPQPPG